MKLSIAVLALISATEARHHLGRRSESMNIQLGVRFADGQTDEDFQGAVQLPKEVGVRFVQERSDPIHGSLGPPKVNPANLTPAQQFELKQRNTPKPVLVDDPEQVVDTLNSIKIAEELTGGKMPSPSDPVEKKKVSANDTKYTLADSDDETEDTVETRRSVQWAENELKRRWFINAGEKRQFEDKEKKGEIRPEVLEFRDKSDADPQASADSITQKEVDKKAALVKGVEEKKEEEAKKEADSKKTKEELAAEKAEKEDEAARKAAQEAGAAEDKKIIDADKAKKTGEPAQAGTGDDGSAKKAAEKKADAPFCPPELAGMC